MAATTASLGVAMSDVVVDSLVVATAPPRTQAGALALLKPWRSHLSPTSPHISPYQVEQAREDESASSGSLQSLCWTCQSSGGLASAYLSGSLLETMRPQ